jgi:hypothetical protein
MVQPSPCEVVPQTGRKAAAGGSPYLGHPHEVAAAGVPSRTPPARRSAGSARPRRQAPALAVRLWCRRGDFGRR